MSAHRRSSWALITMVLIMTLSFPFVPAVTCASYQEKLEQANKSLEEAFLAVRSAEEKGADVKQLVQMLNEAQNLIDKAQQAYEAGDVEAAEQYLENSISISNEIIEQANSLGKAAEQWRQITQILVYVTVPIAVVAITYGAWRLWRWWERRSMEELLEKEIG